MIDWQDYGIYTDHLPTDWQHVVTIGTGGYEWARLHAFWSPTTRRFYWYGSAGCSCNSWGGGITHESDFRSGDREALKRAVRAFVDDYEHFFSPGDALSAIAEISRFKENPND